MTSGLSAEALRASYGRAGPDLGLFGQPPEVLRGGQPIAAQDGVAATVRSAFVDYQARTEERRLLAADIGECTAELTSVLCAAGFSDDEARGADVRALAAGVLAVPDERG